ncbi:hypothetical protein KR044_001504 [Drosophila immigrans]|nr:hypothetical protein KR044_001504 [Drosophila immigrans]
MRLLILSLLAWTAHGHAISYRSNLQAFAPARGEFPVQSELAQGYLRYLDNTGAERLVGFNYPEPLYGIRREIYTPEQLRAGSTKLEAQQQHLALFRAWCEQRYNALRIELERLRAEGKQPSANILSQFEPLEQLIKTNAFEPVPGLSPEVQRARDEHLRIWNESRLQVLQAELAQGGQQQAIDQQAILLKTQQAQPQQPAQTKLAQEQLQIKQATSNLAIQQQPYVPLESPKPVQETAEVLRAREEHLRLYNEALQAQPAAALKTTASFQPLQAAQLAPQLTQLAPQAPKLAPQPTPQLPQASQQIPQLAPQLPQAPKLAPQLTPLIPQAPLPTPQLAPQLQKLTPQLPQLPKLAALPAQMPLTPQLAPLPVEETPEVKRAREEHLKQFNAEIQRQQQQSIVPLPTAGAKIAFEASKKPEAIAPLPAATIKSSIPLTPAAAPIPTKNIHDQKIILLTQSKLKAEDKVADYEDKIRLEERERDEELFREKELRREEQKQAELEQEREQLRLLEEQQLLEAERLQLQLQEKQRIESERLQETKRLQAEQQFIFAVDNTPSQQQPSSSYKLIAPTPVKPQPQPQPQPQAIAQQQQVQNGFFLRIQAGQQGAEAYPETIAQNPFLIRYIQQPQQAQVKVLSSATGSASASTSTSSFSSSSNSIAGEISELEKARREHFMAHEIALEQLRLANLKDAEASAIPCQHN